MEPSKEPSTETLETPATPEPPDVPEELESRLADVGHHLQMVQKFRNVAPDIGANQSLFQALDRHEQELRVKQTVLREQRARLLRADS